MHSVSTLQASCYPSGYPCVCTVLRSQSPRAVETASRHCGEAAVPKSRTRAYAYVLHPYLNGYQGPQLTRWHKRASIRPRAYKMQTGDHSPGSVHRKHEGGARPQQRPTHAAAVIRTHPCRLCGEERRRLYWTRKAGMTSASRTPLLCVCVFVCVGRPHLAALMITQCRF